MSSETHKPYSIGPQQIQLLERLCNTSGISGDEGEVRKIVLEQVRPHAQEIKIDSMGNVLVTCRRTGVVDADQHRLKVLIAAHMDEVGLMLVGQDGDGFFRFDTVGGIDERQLVAKTVLVGPDRIPGVIGPLPIHLTSSDELKRSISASSLRIDVGASNASRVSVGDAAVFSTQFSQVGPSLRAKALDDRIGVATLIELVKNPPANIDLYAAFTVQEEVGLRGAKVAAYALDPEVVIALDTTPANDLPTWEGEDGQMVDNARYNARLGCGPAIYLADGGTFSDPRLIRLLVETAEAANLPYQFRQPGGGRTDVGMMHLQRQGIPGISLSVPGRYMHTAAGLMRLTDWENTLNLIALALVRLTPSVLAAGRTDPIHP